MSPNAYFYSFTLPPFTNIGQDSHVYHFDGFFDGES